MMISLKRPIKIALLMFALTTPKLRGQSNDLQTEVHKDIDRYAFGDPSRDDETWEKSKKVLTSYGQNQLVSAIIIELEDDRGNEHANRKRDFGAGVLFRLLSLPHSLVCNELNKQLTPRCKASLMFVLQGDNSPEARQALLRQLGDRRLGAREPAPMEIGTPHAFRVCDVAFSILVENSGVKFVRTLSMRQGDDLRDEVIQEGLKELHLNVPGT